MFHSKAGKGVGMEFVIIIRAQLVYYMVVELHGQCVNAPSGIPEKNYKDFG